MVSVAEVFIDYHLIDFFVLIILAIIWGMLNKINPRRLFVPKRDPRCNYPHYNSGITELQNLCVVVGVPLIVYILLYIFMKTNVDMKYCKPFNFLLTIVGHIGSIELANIIACILKIQVGRPRPDFFAVLGTNTNAEAMCPEDLTEKEFNEEFKSFPSGHSASAMSGTLFLVLFLNAAIKSNQYWVRILVFSLLIYPFIVGSTRITQHRHHPDDVIMGLFVGFVFPVIYFIGCYDYIFVEKTFP